MPLIYIYIFVVAVSIAALFYFKGKANLINIVPSAAMPAGCVFLLIGAMDKGFLFEHYESLRLIMFIAGSTSLIIHGRKLFKQIGILKDQ